jgi:hypothetical protein
LTWIEPAPSTTCAAVAMSPCVSTTKPVPEPDSVVMSTTPPDAFA